MTVARRMFLALLALALPAIAAAQTYTIAPPAYQLVTTDAGRTVNGGCIWTYLAGTTTAATTYTTSTGTANTNPIKADAGGRFVAYLSPGTSYKFVFENTPCTVSPPVHGTTLKTVDNISAMPTSAASVDDTGVAGESITAGQCVYLSAGDGGKNAGQWYKCDSANTYSATTKKVGIATVNISAAGSGTIRVVGLVTGLTSLSVGSDYYVGTAGALTTTPPTNARKLGQAESATTLLLVGNPEPLTGGTAGQVVTAQGSGIPTIFESQGFFNDFRLSLTTAVPVTTSDVTAATTLYWTPYTGNRITLFDSSGNTETCTSAEISIAVPASTSQLYDVWVYDNGTFGTSCTPALELLAWTNDTTRATAIARTNGRYVKSGTSSRLYVGSVRTTTVSGQTEDSLTKRYLWNYYNRVPRKLQRFDSSGYNYTTATTRQANGSASNQVSVVIGVQEVQVEVMVATAVSGAAAASQAQVGIGVDSTTTFSSSSQGGSIGPGTGGTTIVTPVTAVYRDYPAIGKHDLSWNENGGGSGTVTWNNNTITTMGLQGRIDG
jgi:hypothetical protein